MHSDAYSILEERPRAGSATGWTSSEVASRQHRAFRPLLQDLHNGCPRKDFLALAYAINAAKERNPTIIELGCGSGWNYEVLCALYAEPFSYTGLDCSPAMIEIARNTYSDPKFMIGDATATDLPDRSCDILISGTVLMHLRNYEKAIAESKRLARRWCIFHTVPILEHRKTTYLRKLAYGQETIEIIFNKQELERLLNESGLKIVLELPSIDYDLNFLLGERTSTKTYLCAHNT